MRLRALTALVASAAVLLTACTDSGSSSSPDPASTPGTTAVESPSTSSTPTPTPAVERPPKVGDCFRLTPEELTRTTNDNSPVRCSSRHNVETVAVFHPKKRRTAGELSHSCRRAVARHLGATQLELAATMARWVWFQPPESSRRWVSCELVVFANADHLLPLPRRTKGWYDRSAQQLGICGTAAPASERFERVICSRRHTWRVLRALPLAGRTYPGRSVVRKEGDQRCSDAVRRSAGFPLTFTYGWEWPTKAQWKAGQHYGLCWTKK